MCILLYQSATIEKLTDERTRLMAPIFLAFSSSAVRLVGELPVVIRMNHLIAVI